MSQSPPSPQPDPQAQAQAQSHAAPDTTATPTQPPTQPHAPAATPTAAPTPAPAPAPTSDPLHATATPQSQTFTQKLTAGDKYWIFKLAFRAALIVTGIIGIGCMAWVISTTPRYTGAFDYFDDSWATPWTLITFAISVIWCTVCILVFLFRRPNAPVHPGAQVGIDLVLWLAFIVTATFALIACLDLMGWGTDGTISPYSSYGYYYQVENGTWVYNATEYDSYYGRSRDCSTDGYSSRYSGYGFNSCEAEDAYVNQLWQDKGKRVNAELTGVVCQFIGLFLHLALFIWACVDTHYRNKRSVSKDAEKLAADIVQKMIQSGAIIPAPGPAQMRPPIGQQFMQPQPYPQPYPQQDMGQWPLQQPAIPPRSAARNGEKAHGSYYAPA